MFHVLFFLIQLSVFLALPSALTIIIRKWLFCVIMLLLCVYFVIVKFSLKMFCIDDIAEK